MSNPPPALPAQRPPAEEVVAGEAGRPPLGDRLGALLPPCPALDLATTATGLADGPARESVARLLAR